MLEPILFSFDLLLYLFVFLNSLPNDKFLDSSKLKAFADDKLNWSEKSNFRRVENTGGKGQIAHNEQFVLFPVFSKDLYCRHVKTRACLGKG